MDQAALLDAYLGGPDRLRSAVTGLSREQMISRPIAGRWSVLEDVVPGQPPPRRRPDLSRWLDGRPQGCAARPDDTEVH